MPMRVDAPRGLVRMKSDFKEASRSSWADNITWIHETHSNLQETKANGQ